MGSPPCYNSLFAMPLCNISCWAFATCGAYIWTNFEMDIDFPVALTDIMQMSNAAMLWVKNWNMLWVKKTESCQMSSRRSLKKSNEKAMFLPCCAIIFCITLLSCLLCRGCMKSVLHWIKSNPYMGIVQYIGVSAQEFTIFAVLWPLLVDINDVVLTVFIYYKL